METTLHENIVKVRKILGYSQGDLATRMQTAQSTVSSIERGQRTPTFEMLLRVKRGLGCTWAALLDGIE